MKNRISRVKHLPIFLLSALIATNACSPIFYSSIGQNVPMLETKGEVKFSAGHGSSTSSSDIVFQSNSASGFAGQAAFAVGKSTSLIGSYYSLSLNDVDWNGKGTYYEFGVGKFGVDHMSKLYGEVIIGVGSGKIRNSNEIGEFANINYVKPFLQPSGGYRGKNLEFAFTPRLAIVNFNKGNSLLADPDQTRRFNDFVEENKGTVVFEPGITFRAGMENVKFYFQYCYTSFSFPDEEFDPVLDTYISIGFTVGIKPSAKTSQVQPEISAKRLFRP